MDKNLMIAVAQSIAETRSEFQAELKQLRESLPPDLSADVKNTIDLVHLEVSRVFDNVIERQESLKNEMLSIVEQHDSILDTEVEELRSQLKEATGNLETANNDLINLVSVRLDKLDEVKSTPGPIGLSGLGIDSPYWAQGIYREGSVVQHFLGQHFIATKDTSDEPGASDWARIGKGGFKHCGGFHEEATYEVGDIYAKDFATFLVKDDNTHVLLSARGPKGPKGDKGDASLIAGPRGFEGDSVKAVHADERGFVFETKDGNMLPCAFDGIVTKRALVDAIDDSTDFESLKRSLLFMCGAL